MLFLLTLGVVWAHTDCSGPNHFSIPTPDGDEIGLHRHVAPGPPILVVHGISSNHRCWDLNEERSIATTLTAHDLDTWFLDLRGHGCAERKKDGSRPTTNRNFDMYGTIDVHTAIQFIQAETGFSQVAYIGHSMGGHVATAYLAEHGNEAVYALVVVGSPVDFGDLEFRFKVGRVGAFWGSGLPTLPSPWAANQAARFNRLPFSLDELFFAEDSLDSESRKEMYRTVVSPMSRGELRHYRHILREGELISHDGQRRYHDALVDFDKPLLVIGGAGDRVAPAPRVKPYFDLASSTDKTWVEAGTSQGFGHNYGHLDLTLGNDAPKEIHTLIAEWLIEREPDH